MDRNALPRLRTLAIVTLADRLTVAPDILYQAVLDPDCLSPSGEYIRFDQRIQAHSDLHGWFPLKSIAIVEILGEWADDELRPVQAQLRAA